jgi:glycosyltransferase involved in cell wall biosynthesis
MVLWLSMVLPLGSECCYYPVSSFFQWSISLGLFLKQRIRIVHVIESFGGGAFTSVTQIVNHLDPEKFNVYLIYSLRPETPSDFKRFINPNVNLIYLPMEREIHFYKDCLVLYALYREFNRLNPDIVHFHSSKAGALGRVAAWMARVGRVFYSPRGFSFLRDDVGPLKRKLFQFLEKGSAWFGGITVACSKGEYDAARLVSRKVVQINNALDLGLVNEIVEKSDRPRGPLVTIATAGRVSAQKDPGLFRQIAEAVSSARPGRTRFLWIGAGEDEDMLAGGPIEVLGWQPRRETLAILRSEVGIYLQVSRWEGMPLAVLEAMALGLPVVATDVVGNRDAVISGRTGFVHSTPKALEEDLLYLIDHESERIAMGEAGRATVLNEYTMDVLMPKLERLYLG